jgi:hypothetical protein
MRTTLLDTDEVAGRPWADLPNPALKVHATAAAAAWPMRSADTVVGCEDLN